MMNKGLKTIHILLFLVLGALIGVLVFGIYDIKKKNAEVSRIVNETDLKSQNEKIIESIKTLRENNTADLLAFEAIVFTNDQLVPLIESIEGVGRALGLVTKIVSVSELDDKKTSEPKLIKISIETTKGSWSSTLAFLKAMENLPHRVLIDETALSKEGTDWRLRMTVSLHAFN